MRVHTVEERGPCILELLKDKSSFLNRIWSLARNKAPGKDGIPNEILMNLPEDLLTSSHDLFVLRYMMAAHLRAAKIVGWCSCTKRKTHWTSEITGRLLWLTHSPGLLTDCMTDYAEHHDILSTSQEGFRRAKGAARQFLMMHLYITQAPRRLMLHRCPAILACPA